MTEIVRQTEDQPDIGHFCAFLLSFSDEDEEEDEEDEEEDIWYQCNLRHCRPHHRQTVRGSAGYRPFIGLFCAFLLSFFSHVASQEKDAVLAKTLTRRRKRERPAGILDILDDRLWTLFASSCKSESAT